MSDSDRNSSGRTRRLSAVMFTDMAGYSSLTQENETLALELLDEHCRILRGIFPKYHGREVDTAGDSFFVEFGSALDATTCAIEIQNTLHERNSSRESDPPILIRIGLHLGDVVHSGRNVQGDGVNIAARMEPLAKPGSICVSEDIARQVHNKIDLPVLPLGRKQLKNIKLPMHAYRIVMPWESDGGGGRSKKTFLHRPSVHIERPWFYSAIALAVVLVAIWLGSQKFDNDRDGDVVAMQDVPATVVAVFPFSVQGNPEVAYLGRGLVDLLSTKLDGVGGMRTIDPRAVLGAIERSGSDELDPSAAVEVSRLLGAGSFVLGNVFEAGGRMQIDATMYAVDDRPSSVEQSSVEGQTGDIFGLLDGLAAQLIVFDRTGPGSPVDRLEEMTTRSFPALKHYLEGLEDFRAARFRQAADELTLAVAEDSSFALAWYQLATTADWLFDSELGLEASHKAMKYRSRLSERGRWLVEAQHAMKIGSNRQALQKYRDLLTSYPEDVEAWYQLGELQFHAGPILNIRPQESLRAWNRLLYYEPDQITALIHTARLHISANDRSKVEEISRRILEIEPAAERSLELRAHFSLNKPDDNLPQVLAGELRTANDDQLYEVVWSLGSFRDQPGYAERIIPFMTDASRSPETRGHGYMLQGHLDIGRGLFKKAEEDYSRGLEVPYLPAILHEGLLTVLPYREPTERSVRKALADLRGWDTSATPLSRYQSAWFLATDLVREHLRQYAIGLLEAYVGNWAAAEQAAGWLDGAEAPAPFGSLSKDLARSVRAEVAYLQGDLEDAESLLNQIEQRLWYQISLSSPVNSFFRERFRRAQILETQGRFVEGIEVLSHYDDFSIYGWDFAAASHMWRARMYDSIGDTGRAATHYQSALRLWAGSDEELKPMLDEARSRLDIIGTTLED